MVTFKEDDWDRNEKFWKIFNSSSSSIKENSDVDDSEFEVKFNTSNFKLYRFELNSLIREKLLPI